MTIGKDESGEREKEERDRKRKRERTEIKFTSRVDEHRLTIHEDTVGIRQTNRENHIERE